jgi:uncharacterized protein YecE (DUF72 family)
LDGGSWPPSNLCNFYRPLSGVTIFVSWAAGFFAHPNGFRFSVAKSTRVTHTRRTNSYLQFFRITMMLSTGSNDRLMCCLYQQARALNRACCTA